MVRRLKFKAQEVDDRSRRAQIVVQERHDRSEAAAAAVAVRRLECGGDRHRRWDASKRALSCNQLTLQHTGYSAAFSRGYCRSRKVVNEYVCALRTQLILIHSF